MHKGEGMTFAEALEKMLLHPEKFTLWSRELTKEEMVQRGGALRAYGSGRKSKMTLNEIEPDADGNLKGVDEVDIPDALEDLILRFAGDKVDRAKRKIREALGCV